MLASKPIAEELDSLGLLATPQRPQPRPIECDDIPKLVYLTAVIKVWDEPSRMQSPMGTCCSIDILVSHVLSCAGCRPKCGFAPETQV